jgi:hypothetical protein
MTRRERVKAAINHQTPDKTPVFIHLAPDALHAYGEALWERYGREDMRRLRDEGKIENRNALYYSMGSHVCLLENFPWWWWKDLPAEYGKEEAPDFIPDTMDMDVPDEIMPIHSDEAFAFQRRLSHELGILVGISAGAAAAAAVRLAGRPEFAGKTIVVILPDTGERYLSVIS